MDRRAWVVLAIFCTCVPVVAGLLFFASATLSGWMGPWFLGLSLTMGLGFGITSIWTLRWSHGPIGFFLQTFMLGSVALLVVLASILWTVAVLTQRGQPDGGIALIPFFVGFVLLCQLPGVLVSSVLVAYAAKLPSIASEIRWFWTDKH